MSVKDAADNVPIRSANDTTSTSALFEARKFYEENTLKYVSTDYFESVGANSILKQIPFGNLYKNNALLGLIDLDGDIIIPKTDNNNFSVVGRYNNKNIRLHNFVADAFMDMKNYLNRQALKNAFSQESPYFNITARKGYSDFNRVYPENYLVIANKFREKVLADKILDSKITNHLDFNKEYIKFLTDYLTISTVTKSMTAVSYNFEIFSSGLIFTIADDDPGDDINKYARFFLDQGFICFAEACQRFGFKMDKNIPFMLMADLNSPAMKPYFERYNIKNVKELLSNRFNKMHLEDIDQLKQFFYNSYATFLVDNLTYGEDYSKICARDASKNIVKQRNAIDYSTYIKEFPESYWFKIYVYLKNIETRRGFTQVEFDNLIKVVTQYARFGFNKKAYNLINAKFNSANGVEYFDSLQRKSDVLEIEQAFGVRPLPQIIL